MTFELTESLTDSLLFAMENQVQEFCIDASRGALVEKTDSVVCDENTFYSLPRWESSDGYTLREEFANNLHSPLARADLKRVLTGGRGVFKNFKNVLKSYPEVERQWNFYKSAALKKRINHWYNELCESWGLECMPLEEEETQELVESDFIFSAYNFEKDAQEIWEGKNHLSDEIKSQFCGELGDAVDSIYKAQTSDVNEALSGYICRSQEYDFAGCILYSACPLTAENSVAVCEFFVEQKYRGLGIGKELILKCITDLKEKAVRWILVSNILLPKSLELLLEQTGFKKLGSGYAADLLLI